MPKLLELASGEVRNIEQPGPGALARLRAALRVDEKGLPDKTLPVST